MELKNLAKRWGKFSKKDLKRQLASFVAAVFTFGQVLATPIFAATTGDVTGSFATKAVPVVSAVAVKTVTATAVVTGNIVIDTTSAALDFSGTNLSFTLNGTLITLTGGAGSYANIAAVATQIQTQLTTASNTTVTVTTSGTNLSARIVMTAVGQNIVINGLTGTLSQIGLTAGTTTAATGSATSLTPNNSYNIEVTIDEPDGIGSATGGLNTLTTKIWYDSVGTQDLEGFYDLQTTPATRNYALISWDRASNTATLSAGVGSSWSLTSSTLPSAGNLADGAYIQHIFVYTVRVGEISNITSGGAKWQIAAKVADTDASAAYGKLSGGLAMDWYGKITLANTTVNWGRTDAGMAYSASAARTSVAGITFLSNGDHYQKVKAATTWTALDLSTVARANPLAANKFDIVSDSASTYSAGTAKVIPVDGVTPVALNASALPASTTYTPTAVTNYLYLATHATFPAGKTYSGTVTYLIANS